MNSPKVKQETVPFHIGRRKASGKSNMCRMISNSLNDPFSISHRRLSMGNCIGEFLKSDCSFDKLVDFVKVSLI